MQKVKSHTTGTRCHGEMQSRVELFSAGVWLRCATDFTSATPLSRVFAAVYAPCRGCADCGVFFDTRESSPPSPVTSTWWLHPYRGEGRNRILEGRALGVG